MKEFYTYHKEPIYIISVPTYFSFKKMIDTNRKKTNSKKSINFYNFFQLYVNSIIYFNPNKSKFEINNIMKNIMQPGKFPVDFSNAKVVQKTKKF